MDFQQNFINILQTNSTLAKPIFIQNYLPKFITIPASIIEDLSYVLAYQNVLSIYPYNYQISHFDSYCLIYTVSGMGTLFFDNHNYALSPNTLAFIDCKEKHQIEIKQSPWNYKVFFISGTPVPFLYSTFISNYGNLHTFSLGSSVPKLLDKFYSQLEINSERPFLQAKFIVDILLEIIMEKNRLEELDNSIPNYLIKIKNNFDMNYQQNFTLDALEQEYHISKYRICHEFNEQFDVSPIQYLNHKRIEVAKETLIYTDKRINEIGRMVGIENTNHFIRLFKQQTGVTPLVFRKQPPALTFFH